MEPEPESQERQVQMASEKEVEFEEIKADQEFDIEGETSQLSFEHLDPEAEFEKRRFYYNRLGRLENFSVKGHGMVSAVETYDNKYLFVGNTTRQLLCYEIETGELVYSYEDHYDWVTALHVCTIQSFPILLTGGGLSDRALHVFDLRDIKNSIQFITTEQVHFKSVTQIKFNSATNQLITCSSDGTLKIWQIVLSEILPTSLSVTDSEKEVQIENSFDETPVGQTRLIGFYNSQDRKMRKMKVSNISCSITLLKQFKEEQQIYSMCESDDNLIVYGTNDALLKVFQIKPRMTSNKILNTIKLDSGIWNIQRFTNFKYVVGCSYMNGGSIQIVNVITKQRILTLFEGETFHSFIVLTRYPGQKGIIRNKEQFMIEAKNMITIIATSKQGKIMCIDIGGDKKRQTQFKYSIILANHWIPWTPFAVVKLQENEEEESEMQQYRIFCSTGNHKNTLRQVNNDSSQYILGSFKRFI